MRNLLPAFVFLMSGALIAQVPLHEAGSKNARDRNRAAVVSGGDLEVDEAIALYSKEHGTTAAEALRRLKLQDEQISAIARIRREFQDRLAGVYIQHEPGYSVVVRLTGDQDVSNRELPLPSGRLEVSFETGALVTLECLRSALKKNRTVLTTTVPEIQGTGIDQRTGEVVIRVFAPQSEEASFLEQDKELERMLGVPVRIEVEQIREGNVARRIDASFFPEAA
jgi:hypothetical protein